jgi:hypothetical protein
MAEKLQIENLSFEVDFEGELEIGAEIYTYSSGNPKATEDISFYLSKESVSKLKMFLDKHFPS